MIRTVLAAAALAAVVAGPAGAKAPIDARICGASECREIRGEGVHADLVADLVLTAESTAFATVPPLAPYYRVELSTPGWEFPALHVVPSARVAERNTSWIRLGQDTVAAFERVAGPLEPRPAPVVERALVNGRPSGSPRVYEGVFGTHEEADAPPAGTPSAELRLETDAPSPWTDGVGTLLYYPTLDVLRRPGEWVALPPELVDGIESDLVSVRKGESGPSFPARAGSAALVLGLGGVAWMTIVRRRRPAAPGP